MTRRSMLSGLSAGIAATALSPSLYCAQTPAPTYIASLAANGVISIRRADTEAPFATVRPALFEPTWQMRAIGLAGAQFGDASGNQTRTTGRIAAPTAKATVAVTGEQGVEKGTRLVLRYTMTADKAVPVNSAHVSVDVPSAQWIGAKATIGNAAPLNVPAQAGAVRLAEDAAGSVTLESPRARLTVRATGGPGALLQDNRAFGADTLEMRFSARNLPGGDALPAGQPVVWNLTLDLPGTVTLEKQAPVTLRASPDWIPFEQKLDVTRGSALDFSALNAADAPAGKWGRVIVRNGHFALEKKPGPARFWGANLCFGANYLTHEEADQLAERLARLGYNSVRIHHYEGDLVDQSKPDTLTLRPDNLDKLDYLIAACKKRGLYITTDLFVSRPVKPGETAEGATGDDFKADVYVSPSALANWKAFSRVLLTHVNPYTKMAWKDDPTIAWLSCINEPNLTNRLGRFSNKVGAIYADRWHQWLTARYPTDAALVTAWGEQGAGATRASAPLPDRIEDNARGRDTGAFLATIHRAGYRAMADFLRKEIGTKALLTDMNGWSETPAFMAARADFDFVDNHFYWDHPQFLEKDWQLPSQISGRSAVEAGGAGPSSLSMTRLIGKPFTVTEFNYAVPNHTRAEGGLLMGAASALQDWDGIWRFAYSHSREGVISPRPLGYFDVAVDPANLAGERAAVLLYLRRDLPAARSVVARTFSAQQVLGPTPAAAPRGNPELTLVTQVGTLLTPSNAASDKAADVGDVATLRKNRVLPDANRTNIAANVRESDNGAIYLDGNAGLLAIDTPRTVGGAARAGAELSAGPLTARLSDARAIVWASAVDNQPITTSKRVLLAHVTEVVNTGMRFATPERTVLEAWGDLPHLVRRGSASVTLRHPNGKPQAWRLDAAGNRTAPLTVKRMGDTVTLDLSTIGPDNKATLYYELVFN